MAADLELTIRLSNGTRLQINAGPTTPSDCTVLHIKQKLVSECPVERQRLIYKGKILEDDRVLHDYGIVPKATLFLVKAAAPKPANPPAPSPSTTAPTPSSAPSFPASNPSTSSSTNNSAPTNPWAAASGNAPNPFGMDPMMNPMNADPQQMQAMMQSPMMQSLLDNPQMLQSMMEMQMQTNPQMRQLMESNPQLRQMMSDPAVLQQVTQMMRNPGAMQQAMRNQDLAMSNIENMPGGFAALSSMYRDVQSPLEESMRNNPTPTAANNNRQQFDAGASGSAMPNPWGDNSATASNNSATNNNTTSSSSTPSANSVTGNPWAAASQGAGSSMAAANPWASMMGMPGGMPQPGQPPSQEQMNAALNMLENPMVQQMMDQAMQQNPDMFRQMLEAQNPMMAQMFANNPEAANNFVRSMMNPQTMRSMLSMQQAFGGMMPPPGQQAPGNATTGQSPAMDFSSLLQSMNNSGMPPPAGGSMFGMPMVPPQQPQQAPADRYRSQLRSLYDMGFDDEQQCLAAMERASGNLNRAVDMLLAGEIPSSPPAPATDTSATPAPAQSAAANSNAESSPNAPPKDDTEKKND